MTLIVLISEKHDLLIEKRKSYISQHKVLHNNRFAKRNSHSSQLFCDQNPSPHLGSGHIHRTLFITEMCFYTKRLQIYDTLLRHNKTVLPITTKYNHYQLNKSRNQNLGLQLEIQSSSNLKMSWDNHQSWICQAGLQ